jgi:hypothetical protein
MRVVLSLYSLVCWESAGRSDNCRLHQVGNYQNRALVVEATTAYLMVAQSW